MVRPSPARLRRRSAILEAAGALFVTGGVAATSMEAIAERAGVSRATVFNHFGGKRELLLGLYDRQLDRLAESLRTSSEQSNPRRAVAAFFRSAETVLRADGDLTPLLIREVLYDPALLAHDVARGDDVRRELIDRVRAAQRAGQLRRTVPATQIAAIMMDLWTASLVPWVLAERRFGLAAHVMRKIRLVLRGLGADPREASPR
ncbi:MAG: TetR/AcrR family transcriptional regulator [Gemmatimonadaceae bacterium]|nr:TetR/AcrR family transcriptional regulator [Gemmatimonadaceae bacterium]